MEVHAFSHEMQAGVCEAEGGRGTTPFFIAVGGWDFSSRGMVLGASPEHCRDEILVAVVFFDDGTDRGFTMAVEAGCCVEALDRALSRD